MRVPRATWTALAVVALLGLTLWLAGDAQAIGGDVRVEPGERNVIQGNSVPIEVFFGTGDEEETVRVTCDDCSNAWTRTVRYDQSKANCGLRNATRICVVSFPEGFRTDDEARNTATSTGEPSRRSIYRVTLDSSVEEDASSFQVWLATANTCREHEAWRNDVIMVSSSGHPRGETITFRVTDVGRREVVLEETRVSVGQHVPYRFLWEIPLDYPLGSDGIQQIRVEVTSDTKSESEVFPLRPGSPTAFLTQDPGKGDQPSVNFERTEDVRYWFRLLYLSAPVDCQDVSPFRRVIPVLEDDLVEDSLVARVDRMDTVAGVRETEIESVDFLRAQYVDPLREFWINWTIPKDAQATRNGTAGYPGSPEYRIFIPEQQLTDGNVIRVVNSSIFRVHPHRILPVVEEMPEEVERLEAARVTFNVTYADGTPVTPEDLDAPLEAELKPVGDDPPIDVFELNHQENGLWNASFQVPFDYEPLGEYRWILKPNEDTHGERDKHNRITETASPIFEIVGAKPLIDFHTFVGEEEVNGTERTKTVHVTLTAEYKNGLPLTSENVDPGLGGVVLNVKKTNRFGRILDIDSLVMTDADNDGTWVRTFRIGRTESEAPVGTWELEVIAGDDRDPTNRNETRFDFPVRPAHIVVAPATEPPQLVDGGDVAFGARLSYPDGTLFT
ncbi:MAG: hypothetical protein R3185_04275, partial [Candidatus Thermoplasmatota archaeon]|nr:hypothetical protein [Candidatus Thermoplasmatota archaeon]